MTINLLKGQQVAVESNAIKVGLGWEPNPSVLGEDFDLDVSVFILNSQKHLPTPEHFVYFNNQKSPDGAVLLSEDDRTGRKSEHGDDETVIIDLSQIDTSVTEMIFVVTIHNFEAHQQNFGQIQNSYIRICESSNHAEILKYQLAEAFSSETAVEFGRLYQQNDQWYFEALGKGYFEKIEYFANKYYRQ